MIRGKINNNTYYRQEANGITLYHLKENKFTFYEGIFLDSRNKITTIDYSNLVPSVHLDLQKPLCVCCLVENSCNLDCIYCFGDDKMYNEKSRLSVEQLYQPLIEMAPLQISLGGGEPTLNPRLAEIIEYIAKHEIAIIMDTNGTTDTLSKFIPILKNNNVLTRVSVDSLDDTVITHIRPYKFKSNQSAAKKILHNIDMLLENGVDVSIQTVLTKFNIDSILDIAEMLVSKKITRWHIAGVKYSEKCKDIYSLIQVSNDIVNNNIEKLKPYFEKIYITHSFEKDFGSNARLLLDVNGEFLTDSVINGLSYIGTQPSISQLYKYLDKAGHIRRYLGDFYI